MTTTATEEVTLVLLSVPTPREAHEGPSGIIPTIKELRQQFNLDLKEAVAITRGPLPLALETGPREVMERKAEALRQWTCNVALMRKA